MLTMRLYCLVRAVGLRNVRESSTAAARLAQDIDRFSQYYPTVLTLQKLLDFGKNASAKNSFQFLCKELPVRLANIMKEFSLLPEQLLRTPSVQIVEGWYAQSFRDIVQFEKTSPDDGTLKKFNDTLDIIRNRHTTVVETMAHGVLEMKEQVGDENPHLEHRIQYFLDRFYMSRISTRMLLNQHLQLFSEHVKNSKHIGAIDPNCNILFVAEDAYENARFLCEQYYDCAPECQIVCHDLMQPKDAASDPITITYIPSHLYHMLFELFKNALRAVVEYHGTDGNLPAVQVLICKGREDITIKISDEGGGIRRSELDLLFNYMYSTAPRPPRPDAVYTAPLAGYGYGLPLSRLYAKYFNGDLWLNSVDGHGTDAMISVKLLAREASELLPVYNKTCTQKYTQSTQIADWSGGASVLTARKMSSAFGHSSRSLGIFRAYSTNTGDFRLFYLRKLRR